MLKNVIVSIIFTCVFSNAFSEWGANYKYDTGTWSNFKSDTLKVVLANNGESDYDKKLKKNLLMHLELVADLKSALREQQFELYYQPKISLE